MLLRTLRDCSFCKDLVKEVAFQTRVPATEDMVIIQDLVRGTRTDQETETCRDEIIQALHTWQDHFLKRSTTVALGTTTISQAGWIVQDGIPTWANRPRHLYPLRASYGMVDSFRHTCLGPKVLLKCGEVHPPKRHLGNHLHYPWTPRALRHDLLPRLMPHYLLCTLIHLSRLPRPGRHWWISRKRVKLRCTVQRSVRS